MTTPDQATESAAVRAAGVSTAPAIPLARAWAVSAICGAALLGVQAADAADRLDETVVPGVPIGALDLAADVLITLAVAVAATPAVRRLVGGRAPVAWRRHAASFLLPISATWIPVVILAAVVVEPVASWRAWVATLVIFRDVRGQPIQGLEIGVVLTVIAAAVAIMPFAERLLRQRPRAAVDMHAVWRLVVGVTLAGVALRTLVVAAGWTEPYGALSWPPARLDAIGAGLAVAALRSDPRTVAARRRIVALSAVTAIAAVAAAAQVVPDATTVDTRVEVWLEGTLDVVAAAAVGAMVAALAGRVSWVSRWLGVTAPGLVLCGGIAFTVISRQYVEAVTDGAIAPRVTGAIMPMWVWSTILAAAIGVLLTATVLVLVRRYVAGVWPRHRYGLALASVVAAGLLVRVTTWLTIAPARTDGGDPFFYHVTANMLAAGRGFPEPHNWLDSETFIASALHGPLYPVVLSLGSRLGGTTYVDHKFVSILIGTATVLLTALVAQRVAGRRAALVAAALAAVYPNLWLIDSLMFPEGLFALLTTACVLVAYVWRDRPTWPYAVLLGVLIGLAGLTRGEGLLLGLLLAAPWVLRHREITLADRWRQLLLAGAACVAVLAPWTIRNATTFDVFVPLSTNGNELIMYANCDDTYAGKFLGFWSFACQERHREEFGEPPGDEAEKALYWRDVGVEYAQDHLDEVPRVVAARVLRQWELFRPTQTIDFATAENRDKESTAVGLVMFYALAGASIGGALVLRRRGVPLLPLVAQFLSVTLTAAYAYASVRFRAPVEPVLCVLAGVWLASLMRPAAPARPM